MKEEILSILSTELKPYTTIAGEPCIDGILGATDKLYELFNSIKANNNNTNIQ